MKPMLVSWDPGLGDVGPDQRIRQLRESHRYRSGVVEGMLSTGAMSMKRKGSNRSPGSGSADSKAKSMLPNEVLGRTRAVALHSVSGRGSFLETVSERIHPFNKVLFAQPP